MIQRWTSFYNIENSPSSFAPACTLAPFSKLLNHWTTKLKTAPPLTCNSSRLIIQNIVWKLQRPESISQLSKKTGCIFSGSLKDFVLNSWNSYKSAIILYRASSVTRKKNCVVLIEGLKELLVPSMRCCAYFSFRCDIGGSDSPGPFSITNSIRALSNIIRTFLQLLFTFFPKI